MALTDTFVRNVKPFNPSGDKYTDGEGMYLFVNSAVKYWRLNYRYLGKRKTMALGVYPETSLAKARLRRANARVLLADGIDPGLEKRQEKLRRAEAAVQTMEEAVARTWLAKTPADRAPSTQEKITGWLTKDIFPYLGPIPIATLRPRDVLLPYSAWKHAAPSNRPIVYARCAARSSASQLPLASSNEISRRTSRAR